MISKLFWQIHVALATFSFRSSPRRPFAVTRPVARVAEPSSATFGITRFISVQIARRRRGALFYVTRELWRLPVFFSSPQASPPGQVIWSRVMRTTTASGINLLIKATSPLQSTEASTDNAPGTNCKRWRHICGVDEGMASDNGSATARLWALAPKPIYSSCRDLFPHSSKPISVLINQ